jgi:chlorobactene glucosyltransferase
MLESLWIYIQINVAIFLAVILFITLSNIKLLGKLGKFPKSDHYPNVSILIPARNEETNIFQCVKSLLNQDYPDFKVIVLDDNSTDNTWLILSDLANNNQKLQIIKGKPLPPDWYGKHWACHQLAQTNNSELILFTDADTRHHPNTLKDAVSAMMAMKADLLTAFPCEKVKTLGECLTVPIFPWFILAFLPLIFAYRMKNPSLSAGIGQFMLFRREAYNQIGGYEAIKQKPVDDVALAKNIKSYGFRWRMTNGVDRIHCRMYNGFNEAFMGFTKNLFAGFDYKIIKFVLIWLCLGFVFIEPIIVLFIKAIGSNFGSFSSILAGSSILLSILIWGASNSFFHFPIYFTFFYPINIIIALIIAFSSMAFALTGKAIWKGRQFAKHKAEWW